MSILQDNVSEILTVIGWIAAFYIGWKLNRKQLYQSTIIETIKYLHTIKKDVVQELDQCKDPNIQSIAQKIRAIRVLLQEIIPKKKYAKTYNLIIEQCRYLMKKSNNFEEVSRNTINEIIIELNKLDNLTLLYPFNTTK